MQSHIVITVHDGAPFLMLSSMYVCKLPIPVFTPLLKSNSQIIQKVAWYLLLCIENVMY